MANGHVYVNNQGQFAQIDSGKVQWVDVLNDASLITPRNHLKSKYPELKNCQRLGAWHVTRLELVPAEE